MPLAVRCCPRMVKPCIAVMVTICLGFGDDVRADDSDLFQTSVAPNVVLMVDNSGSMNGVVWHPDYDPEASNSCSCFSDSTHFLQSSYGWSGCGSGDRYIPPGTYAACGNTREIFIDPVVAAEGNRTRWSGHYLNWFAREGFPKGEIGRLLALMHEIDHNGLKGLLQPLRVPRS